MGAGVCAVVWVVVLALWGASASTCLGAGQSGAVLVNSTLLRGTVQSVVFVTPVRRVRAQWTA